MLILFFLPGGLIAPAWTWLRGRLAGARSKERGAIA
jgi:hypothetical protein